MITIHVGNVGKYKELQVWRDGIYINSGLLSVYERSQYAEKLLEAARELLEGI